MKSSAGSADYSKASFWEDTPEAWREVMPGVRRRVLAHSLTGMLVLYNIESGKVFPLHDHAHAQSGVFLEGGGTFRVSGSSWRVKKGDAYFIPPGVKHELKIEEGPSVIIDFFTPVREDYLAEAAPPDE